MASGTKKTSYTYTDLARDVLVYIRPYRWRFWIGTSLRFVTDATQVYATYALASLIAFFSHYTPGDSMRSFWLLFTVWSVAQMFVTVGRQGAKYLVYQVAEKVNLDSQLSAIEHLSRLDIAWHEKENTGNKLKRVQSGGEGLEKIMRIWIDNLIKLTVDFFGMTIVISFIDHTVSLIMLVFLFSYLIIVLPLSRRASEASRVVNQHEEDFSGLAFETVNNIRTVKAMGMFSYLSVLLQEQSRRIFTAALYRLFRFRYKSAVQGAWAHLFRTGITVLIIYGIVHGRYEVAFLLLFNFYFTNMRTSVEDFSDVSQDIVISRYHVARMRDIFNEKIRIDSDKGKIDFPLNWNTISLQNVSFAYGDHQVLDQVSFDIHRGEKLGIVGLSGAGKSTLFKLLLKEHEDFTGDIVFDGVSIRKIKKSAYFRRVAVVLQETEVFNLSLEENITIANADRAKEKKALGQALEIAHVNDFLSKLPQGVETLIGEKGVKLSGGEKQRLGIARAVFKQPDMLLLDEATSHLDLESEEKIKDSLHKFFQNVTAVVIAHRLTTIQEMDRILLLEGGRLLEEGNFTELMKKKGRFFDLWEKQRL